MEVTQPCSRDSMVIHGTDKDRANAICNSGFRARFNKNRRSFWGTGNYMTNTAEIALAYARQEGPVGVAIVVASCVGCEGSVDSLSLYPRFDNALYHKTVNWAKVST